MGKLRRFLPPQVADLIVASGAEKQLESHRREVTALFCDLRGFTGFSENSDPEDVMALLRDYHAAIGEIVIKYSGTLERFAGDGVMVIFNDPVPVENPALQAVLMALEMRDAIAALTETWRRLGHDIGFGIGIAHGFATLGTIGFEGRFDYAAIGTVSNVASRLCDEAKPGQILISPRVLMNVENAVKVEPVGEFELKGIRRPLAAYKRGFGRRLSRATRETRTTKAASITPPVEDRVVCLADAVASSRGKAGMAHSSGSPAFCKPSSIIGVLTVFTLNHLMVICGLSRRASARAVSASAPFPDSAKAAAKNA